MAAAPSAVRFLIQIGHRKSVPLEIARRQALEHLLLLPPTEPPTALVCCDDLTVVGVLNAAYRHKIVVSDDLSVIGFDDLTIVSYAVPPRTTVRRPKQDMGRVATEIVLSLLAGSITEKSNTFQPI